MASATALYGLSHGGGHLGRGVHAVSELGLLAVVQGQTLQEQRSETGAQTSHVRAQSTSESIESMRNSGQRVWGRVNRAGESRQRVRGHRKYARGKDRGSEAEGAWMRRADRESGAEETGTRRADREA
jgi:hypothetical protein